MAVKVITPSTTEPVSLAEAKLHLKLDTDTTDDTLVTALIKAARELAEDYCRRVFMSSTYELYLEDFPDCDDDKELAIDLLTAPISAITSIKYYDTLNVLQTLDSSTYELDDVSQPCRVLLKYYKVWPYGRGTSNSVIIRYVAGYTSAATVPASIKAAMLLIIGHLYENREDVVVGRQVNELPKGSQYLLNPYRLFQY